VQATTADAAGLHTTYTFTLNGNAESFTDTQLSQVIVTAQGGPNTASIFTNDTYLGTDGLTHETGEAVVIGDGFALVEKLDAGGNPLPFLQIGGFTTIYATAGHADPSVIAATPGVQNTFVSAGGYSYIDSGSAFYLMTGAKYVYSYAVGQGDMAIHYDGSGPSAYVVAGTAYSLMLGTDNGQSFFNEAVGFTFNEGIAQHAGQDLAFFYAETGADQFAGYSQYSALRRADGSAENDSALFFDQVYAYSAGGSATALVDDSRVNHTVGFRPIA